MIALSPPGAVAAGADVAARTDRARRTRSCAAGPAPAVTVIVPAYNAAASIERTLASVRDQTLADFECLIIDDGSSDDTAVRAAAWIAQDERFSLIRQPNAGVAGARNRGLRQARGRYVANLDADDMWRPEFLARTVESLERAGPGATMAFARSVWIGSDDAVLSEPPPPLHHAGFRDLLIRNPIGNGSAALMRLEAVRAWGGWDGGLVRDFGQTEDWLLQLQLAAVGEVIVIDEPLVLYRISEASASWDLRRTGVGTLEVIRRARMLPPRLAQTDYRAARSFAMLALLRRARRKGDMGLAWRFAAQAYLRNPAWFREPELREPFVAAPAKALRLLRRVWAKPPP